MRERPRESDVRLLLDLRDEVGAFDIQLEDVVLVTCRVCELKLDRGDAGDWRGDGVGVEIPPLSALLVAERDEASLAPVKDVVVELDPVDKASASGAASGRRPCRTEIPGFVSVEHSEVRLVGFDPEGAMMVLRMCCLPFVARSEQFLVLWCER